MTSVTTIQFGDLPAIRVQAPDGAEATITLFGAHLVSWQPSNGAERMFCSTRTRMDGSKSIRGGVPVIFPQFSERGQGMRHGFARMSIWRVGASGSCGADDAASFVEFELGSDDALPVRWPHQFGLTLRVELEANELRMRLVVRNTGAQPFAFSAAFHTYLLVDEVGQITLDGLQRIPFEDHLRHGEQGAGQDDVLRIPDALDRIYYNAPQELTLSEGSRRTLLAHDGFKDIVVWNPGAEAAAALPDLAPDEYRQFLCVEPATIVPAQLAPGAEWIGSYRVRTSA